MEQAGTNARPEVISVRHLWAGYGSEVVLEDINLSVRERDFIGLIGPNGGGKTTFIKVLLGLVRPMKGEVKIKGQNVKEGRRYVGYVPQEIDFDRGFPISAWEVARMGRLSRRGLLHRFNAEDDEAVAQSLRDVGMLEMRQRPIGALSGGQRKRIYIARALVTEPEILLLDEPTASVDTQGSGEIYELLRRLNERVTIIIVSHDLGAISSYVKTIGCLNRTLFYHGEEELRADMVSAAYQCPVDLLAHGVPHRVLAEHPVEEGEE